MVRIGADVVQQRAGRRDDLLKKISVGPEQIEKRGQFLTDPLADHGQRRLVGQETAQHLGQLVQQLLMPALRRDGGEQLGRQRRQLHLLDLGLDAAGGEVRQAGLLDRRQRLGHQPGDELRQPGRAGRVGEPFGHHGGEVDLAQLAADRLLGEEVRLDEAAQIVGDAALVRGDDGRVRDGQAQRPAKQRHDGVPVGDAADGGGLGEGGEEAEPRKAGFPALAAAKTATQRARSSAAIALVRRSAASFSASAGDRPRPAGPLDVSGWCVAALKVIAGRLRR